MKILGIVLVIAGLFYSIFCGFIYLTQEDSVKSGEIEVLDQRLSADWAPLAGVVLIVAGGVVYLIGRNEE